MLTRLRIWLLLLLANGDPVVLNLHLREGLHLDANKTVNGLFINLYIDGGTHGIKTD